MQRTGSSGSFGSFDGSSVSNKSVESSYPPDAPTEKSVHSAVNHQIVASPVENSIQLSASPPNNHNLIPQKPADLGNQTTASRKPSGAQTEAAVPPPVPAQPTTFTPLDLFDQATVQSPVTSAAPIDLFAGFNEQSLASHKTNNFGSHFDIAKEPAHNGVIQKTVIPSTEVPTTSHPVPQDFFSLSILQEPATSSPPPPIDLFAGFDQELPQLSSVQQIPSASPLHANGGWAFFGAQHGSLKSVSNVQPQMPAAFPPSDGIAKGIVSNVQAQMPVAFPPSDGIAKGIDQSTLPTSPPNAIGLQSTPSVMDNWSLNVEEVKISVPKENSQVKSFGI